MSASSDFLQHHNNYNWLISCAADRMRPAYLDPLYADWWRIFVWQGVTQLRCKLHEVRWELVRGYALNSMAKYMRGD